VGRVLGILVVILSALGILRATVITIDHLFVVLLTQFLGKLADIDQ